MHNVKKMLIALCVGTSSLLGLNLQTAHRDTTTERPHLKALSHSVQAAKHTKASTLSDYIPQITATHTSYFENLSGTHTDSHTLALRGTQLIYDPAGPQNKNALARHDVSIARHTLDAASHSARKEVTYAFLDAWLITQKNELFAALLAYSSHLLERARLQHTSAQDSHHDYEQIRISHAAHVRDNENNTHQLHSALDSLLCAIGKTPGKKTSLTLSYVPTKLSRPKEKSFYLEKARALRPELKQKDEEVARQDLQTNIHKKGFLPTVSVAGSVSKTFSGTNSELGPGATFSLGVSWPIFDGFKRNKLAQSAQATGLYYRLEKQELHNTISKEVSSAYHQYLQNLETLKIAKQDHQRMQGLLEKETLTASCGKTDTEALLKKRYECAQALHAWRTEHVAARKAYEALLYSCGYPSELRNETC